MTIGFDASRVFVKERTGTENYSYQLLKELSRIDSRNKYMVYTRPYHISSMIIELMKQFPKNFQFKEIPWPRFWTQGGLALQTFKDDLDVFFVPAHTLPLIRKPGLKTVMTVHDLGVEYLPKLHQLKQQVYLKYIIKYQLASATKLIAVSKATKEDLIKKAGIDPKKITVIYEGYDREKFQIPNSKFQNDILVNSLRQYGLKPGQFFLFVGTVQPRKNLARLIQAFAKFSSMYQVVSSVVIVGQKGWMSEEIYGLPKKLGIEHKVKFLGYVPDKAMPALYSGAIALAFPSLFEGFGLPILEAQASGCPVLTSNVSSMPEVAGKGAIYVNPTSLDDIIRGMREIGETRRRLIKAGFENIKRFSWEKCAAQTLEVLERA